MPSNAFEPAIWSNDMFGQYAHGVHHYDMLMLFSRRLLSSRRKTCRAKRRVYPHKHNDYI